MSELVVTGHCKLCGTQVVDGDPSCSCWDPYDWEQEEPVGERYGWEARLGDVILGETERNTGRKEANTNG